MGCGLCLPHFGYKLAPHLWTWGSTGTFVPLQRPTRRPLNRLSWSHLGMCLMPLAERQIASASLLVLPPWVGLHDLLECHRHEFCILLGGSAPCLCPPTSTSSPPPDFTLAEMNLSSPGTCFLYFPLSYLIVIFVALRSWLSCVPLKYIGVWTCSTHDHNLIGSGAVREAIEFGGGSLGWTPTQYDYCS